jgi:hypothetical protein
MSLTRVLATTAVTCVSYGCAYAQTVELREVRLLASTEAPEQTSVFEMVNDSDSTIKFLAVSCHLIDEAGKPLAVKVVRFRDVPPGSSIGDAGFPMQVRGADAICRRIAFSKGFRADIVS